MITQHQRPPTAAELIRAAIAAAGRGPAVSRRLGVSTSAVNYWGARGNIPAVHIAPLCELQSVVRPEQILDAMAREAREKAAA